MISVGTEYYGERMAAREAVIFKYLRIFPGTLLLGWAEVRALLGVKSNSY